MKQTTESIRRYWGIIYFKKGGNMMRDTPVYGWRHYDY